MCVAEEVVAIVVPSILALLLYTVQQYVQRSTGDLLKIAKCLVQKRMF